MNKTQYYRNAFNNLGLLSLVRRQIVKNFGKSELKLTSKFLNSSVYARRHSSDLSVFDQIFVEREYRCLDHLNYSDNILTIMDLGANCGYSSAYFLSRFPNARLIAVEPDKDNFAMLSRNLAPYKERAEIFMGAAWSECRDLFFEESSTNEGNEWGRRTIAERNIVAQPVKAWDVPTLMKMVKFDTIDILKIDIEGAEEEVFCAVNMAWLDKVKNIVIELHGPQCEIAFNTAIRDQRFTTSECGELKVCIR